MFESGGSKFLYPGEHDNLYSIEWKVDVCGDRDWIHSSLVISSYGKQIAFDLSGFKPNVGEGLEVLDTIIEQLIKMRTNYNKALKILEGTD